MVHQGIPENGRSNSLDNEIFAVCADYCENIIGLTGAHAAVLDLRDEPAILDFGVRNKFCSGCLYEKRDELRTHSYGVNEAYRWAGKYIYYCPLGLVFVASPISFNSGKLSGGIVLGPLIMGSLQDTVQEFAYPSMNPALSELPVLNTAQVRHLSGILSAVTVAISGNPHSVLNNVAREQERLMNAIYDARKEYGNNSNGFKYPIETESRLCAMIVSGDKAGSQKLLNELLGHIFFYSSFDMDEIKARTLELIVVLSRAAISAGADTGEIFRFSTSSIRSMEKFDNIDQISLWLSSILHRFLSSTFDYVKIKHHDVVYKVMEFIKDNYIKKVSLDELAQQVFLSKSYLSSIFKEEMNINISVYINKVRVERSKSYLSDTALSISEIAQQCGFEDQSYFTKVFKKQMGISPKKYRDSRVKTFSEELVQGY
jgi:two-component system response regulator YesN